jgi:tRNA G18 (ribose-2'-O)-methylase SpoU
MEKDKKEIVKLSMDELNRKSVDEFIKADKFPVVVVLENVRSAYNVGSVFRTADAFLLQSLYIIGYTAIPPHKEIKKTALGAEDSVQWRHFKDTATAITELRGDGYTVYAVEQAQGSVMLQDFEPGKEKIAVIFGNEVSGVEQSTIEMIDGCIEIPQLGMKHSLNISVAAGIVLWEIVRKRVNAEAISITS